MNKTPKRIAAAIVSLALGLSAGSYAMPMATAQTAPVVDLSADVTLTIEKREGEVGSEVPLGNVTFTVQKVDIAEPLDTVAAWDQINNLDMNSLALIDGATWTRTTDAASGNIVINNDDPSDDDSMNFEAGVYLVTETQLGNYSVAPPFLVALPFTDGNGEWAYSQTVTPKNQALSVSKGVTDAGATIGSDITYTIRAAVPGTAINRFNIEDVLPAELGAPQPIAPATEISVRLSNGSPLPSADYEIVLDGNSLRVEFTSDGFETLETAREDTPDLAVLVEFQTEILSIPDTGSIINHVTVELPGGGTIDTIDPDDPEGPGEGAETRIGNLDINLINQDENPLTVPAGSDSKFELWRCISDGSGGFDILPDTQVSVLDPANSDVSTSEFTIPEGADSVTLEGFQAYNWANGVAVAELLCAIQTKAPKGYVLNPEPQKVDFVDENVNYDMAVDVTNLPDTLAGNLPATGGKGALMIIAAGLVVAAAGGTVAVRGNRARKNA